ncbi:hypothetical protein KQI84_01595 [bacterium]|nr:hypothetical protein [bacterium]
MKHTDVIKQASEALSQALASRQDPPVAFAGLDGFIDEIVQVVDKRTDFETYTAIPTISDYAARLAGAAGKSTNIEFVLQQVKMGGNGPLMGDALGRLGSRVHYVGALGYPVMHPVFEPLGDYGEVVSITNPGVTIAAEFEDGKIMHGRLESLAEITWDNLIDRMGGIEVMNRMLAATDLVAMVNWTMIPHMTDVLREFSSHASGLGEAEPKLYFFDLCDPAKRTHQDIRDALEVISGFSRGAGQTILGLNEKESLEVCDALELPHGDHDHAGLLDRAKRLCDQTGIPEIVIHPTHSAVAFGPAGEGAIDGPLCKSPRLTTGAGDHFNGGYCFARVLGLPPQQAIAIGKAVSGFYVRECRGPSAEEVVRFCAKWIAEDLDPWVGV